MSVANPSRAEHILNILFAKYAAVTSANGFRQDIQSVTGMYTDPRSKIAYPRIQVYFGEELSQVLDSAWTIEDIKVPVYAVGTVSGSRALVSTNLYISDLLNKVNAMKQDLRAVRNGLMIDYAHTANREFIVNAEESPFRIFAVPVFDDVMAPNFVNVYSMYGIKLRNVPIATQV